MVPANRLYSRLVNLAGPGGEERPQGANNSFVPTATIGIASQDFFGFERSTGSGRQWSRRIAPSRAGSRAGLNVNPVCPMPATFG